MTALPPRQPNRCGRCGMDWYDTHTCPALGSRTSAPSPNLGPVNLMGGQVAVVEVSGLNKLAPSRAVLLEGLVHWLLDQASVCVADEFASPVTIAFGSDWLVVPDEFHGIVRAYKEASDAGAGEHGG